MSIIDSLVDAPLRAGRTCQCLVWPHAWGWVGRYDLSLVTKELLGGDPASPVKTREYWKPVGSSPVETPPGALDVGLWTAIGFLRGLMPYSRWMGQLRPRSNIRDGRDDRLSLADSWRRGEWRMGVRVMLLNYLKGVAPVPLARVIGGIPGWGLAPIALAPMVAHAVSPFLRSRGGRAIAVTLGVWTALAPWEGPTVLAVTLGVQSLLKAADAWSLALSMLAPVALLLMRRAGAANLVVWVGSVAIFPWRQSADLRQGIRPRPWILGIFERDR
jgi:glycerol-3-phosphate acyltransferase PlsY